MSRALFVSDIHISSKQDPKYALFLRFLDFCHRHPPQALYLLGDIFDLWIADRRFFTERYAEAAARLKELGEAGVEVHYFEGNHDLDLKLYWENKVGAKVYEQAAYFEVNRMVVRVEHGDQMDPDDRGYLFLRWLLRTPVFKFLGRYLPNLLVGWIGRRAARASRKYTSHVKVASEERSRSTIQSHAARAFGQRPFDILVAGHVHVLTQSQLPNGALIFNLGTWLKEPTVLVLDTGSVRLEAMELFLKSDQA